MQRSILIIFFALLVVGMIVAAGLARQQSTSASTPTEAACQMVAAYSTPNLQVVLAIDTLYDGLPMMKTPVVMVATQDKPFAVGCVLPE